MKLLFTTFVLASGLALYAPSALADCGSCGGDDKAHAHEPGHKHEAEKCADCGKAAAECGCEKKADAACDCGKPDGKCDCKKE